MSPKLHHLWGCAPTPLAFYLKALGVLRLAAEQADSSARGWWQDEHFCLLTRLSRAELEQFFLVRYAPTPFLSPWNKGSGFFREGDPGLAPLEESTAERFERFRAGIVAARAELAALSEADAAVRALKTRTKTKRGMTEQEKAAAKALKDDPGFKQELSAAENRFKALKSNLFTPCQLSWRGPHREWMDAAVVLPEEGKPSFPSLLGTGGNDGRLDFTNNAMKRLGEVFDLKGEDGAPRAPAGSLLRGALWGDSTTGLNPGAAIGQFSPGQAGGANSSTGLDSDSLVNPWDFLLMLEGSILFSARSTRRLDPLASSRASAPFAVRAHGCGYGSKGTEPSVRGEQWMPLWDQPSSLGDLRVLFGEGRIQLGRQTASRPVDVARSIAALGTARGITAFQRYGYLERNGQSNLATPLGRISVCARPRAALIDDLAQWVDRVGRQARDKHAPSRLVHAESRLANAVFSALTHDASAERWQAILSAAQAVETLQAQGAAVVAGPIPRLSPEWLEATDDGSAEWRLACTLGSCAAAYGRRRPEDPIRHHWLPLERGARRFATKDKRLRHDVRVVARGRDALADLIAVVQRRTIEAVGRGIRYLPLVAAPGFSANLDDLAAFVAGSLDVPRLVSLAQALMALDWSAASASPTRLRGNHSWPDPAWLMIRLCCLPPYFLGEGTPKTDPAMIRRLASGDSGAAVSLARRRLQAAGVRPPLVAGGTDESISPYWAAALALPINFAAAKEAADRLHPSPSK